MSTSEINYADLIAYASGEMSESEAVVVARYVAEHPDAARTIERFRAAHQAMIADDALDAPPALIARAQSIFNRPKAAGTSWISRLGAAVAELTFDNRLQAAGLRIADARRRIQLSYELDAVDIDLLIERIEPAVGHPDRTLWRVMGQVDCETLPSQSIQIATVGRVSEDTTIHTADDDATFNFAMRAGLYDIYLRLDDTVVILQDVMIE